MPAEDPQFADWDYQSILKEAIARIRVHTPEWTNHGHSDPGVTLLELFAFMADSLRYRANRIPTRNRLKFLKLLGVSRRPASSARGLVVFKTEALAKCTLPSDFGLAAGKVAFRTEDAVDVLPVEARVFYKERVETGQTDMRRLYERIHDLPVDSNQLVFYETRELEPPADGTSIPAVDLGSRTVVGGTLWVALLARKADPDLVTRTREQIKGRVLNLGVYPVRAAEGRSVMPGAPTEEGHPVLRFDIATGGLDASGQPDYERLRETVLGGDLLETPGIAQVRLPADVSRIGTWTFDSPTEKGAGNFPPTLEDDKDEARVVTWLRVRLQQNRAGLRARIGWVGINASHVTQRAHITGEVIGRGNGEPDQAFRLSRTPVVPGSVVIRVGDDTWQEIDDLLAAGPEVAVADPRQPAGEVGGKRDGRVFSVDPAAGVVRFGDGLRGARVPQGATVVAHYDMGGGVEGNVNVGELCKGATLPAGVKVTNPLPTWGGAAGDSVADAEKNLPAFLRHRNRVVTAEDFRDIVQGTPGVDLARVDVLPLTNPQDPGVLSPGAVTLVVVPRHDALHPDSPDPDQRVLDLVCDHVTPRRLVTTEVHVRGPTYVGVTVSIGIEVVLPEKFPEIREAVIAHVAEYLSAIRGGRDGNGWPLGKAVVAQELLAEATRVEGVRYVTGVRLGDATGAEVEQVTLSGFMLPRLLGIDAVAGEPLAPGDVSSGGGDGESEDLVPVPVIPPEC